MASTPDSGRNRLRRLSAVLIGLVLMLAASKGFAADRTPLTGLVGRDVEMAETGLLLFESALEDIWSGSGDSPDALGKLERAERIFEGMNDGAARDYLLARIALYRGRIAVETGSKAQGRRDLERAMDLARRSTEARESADAYRVMADAGASWMVTKGLGGIIRMAPKVSEWSDRALELQPDNALALIISAQGQINAPPAAGGDPAAAAERLEGLLAREDLTDIERYWGSLSLSKAYEKLGREEDARRWCAEAAAMYPSNPMSGECLGPEGEAG